MSLRSRISFGILIISLIGFWFLLQRLADDLKLHYRESTEEPLVDASRILASAADDGEYAV